MKVIILLATLATLLSTGCENTSSVGSATQTMISVTEPEKPIFLLAGIDVSDSGTEADLDAYGAVVVDQVESLRQDRDRVSISVFDHRVREACSEIPADPDAFAPYLHDAMFRPFGGSKRQPGTSQGAAIAAIAAHLRTIDTKLYRVRILLSTDGGYEDHSRRAEKLYADGVTLIANLPDVQVVFYGVRPGLREGVRSKWLQLDRRGRFHIFQLGEEIRW